MVSQRYGWQSIAARTAASYATAAREAAGYEADRLATRRGAGRPPRVTVPEGNLLAHDAAAA
jgi:glycogen(starch) synthase